MANVGFDGRIRNDENGGDIQLRSKQMTLNEGRSIKKQVFGELKNVMQSQHIGSTPIKGNAAKIDGLTGKFGASSSLCNEVLRKQQLKQNFLDAQKQMEHKYKTNNVVEPYKEPVFDEEIFDSWDYERKCCQHEKREEEIWDEMDFKCLDFDRKLILHSTIDDDEKKACPEDPMIFDDFEYDLPPLPKPEISSSSLLDFIEDLSF